MRHTLNNKRGFTVVELLVVAPLVLLTIGTFITVIVNMTGDVLASRASNVLIYNIQDALSRIEDDVKLSTTFLAENNVTLSSPQGFNNGATTKFENVDTTNGDALVLNMLATTGNPLVATSGLIYLQNLPNSCTSTEITQNTPMTMNVVYFVKNNTLWRRTLMQSDYATAGCSVPWQQPSCSPTLFVNGSWGSNTFCKAQDIKLVENINPSDFSVKYFSSASATDASATASDTTSCIPVTDPACVALRNTALQSLATAGVSINVSTLAAGRTISQTGSIRATRLDINASTIAPVTVATTPNTPNSPSASLVNGSQVVFTWPTVAGATGYTFQYQLNGTGGSWTTAFTNQNTTTYTVTANHQDVVYGRVSATNSQGTSSYSSNTSLTIPLWATPLLKNNWTNYLNGHSTVGYTKSADGVVTLKGLIKRSGSVVSGEAVATLPPGYRPAYTSAYIANSADVAAAVNVETNGDITVGTNVTSTYVSLAGITFLASDSSTTWSPLTPLLSGWGERNSTNDPPVGYAITPLKRVFTRGALTSGTITSDTVIANIPAAAMPTYSSFYAIRSGCNIFNASKLDTADGIRTRGLCVGTVWYQTYTYLANSYTGTWNALALGASWVPYNTTYSQPRYTKSSDGIVSVQGFIKNGTTSSGTVIATLPAGFRPSATHIFTNMCNSNVFCRIDVSSSGSIIARTGVNAGYTSLDNITFVAEQ